MKSRLPPVASALAIQLVAGMVCFGAALAINRNAEFNVPFPWILAAQGLLAALITWQRQLPVWWIPIQLVMPAAVAGAMALEVPSWIYLLAFLGIWMVYTNASAEGVPLYLTNRKTWQTLARLLPETEGSKCIDLGSGLGGTTLYLANSRPDLTFEAIETAPFPFALSWLRFQLFAPPNCQVRYLDIWKTDLSAYDWVYCFLSPQPMPRLYEKASQEMKPGTTLISNSFNVPDHEAREQIEVDDGRKTRLLIWKMSGNGSTMS